MARDDEAFAEFVATRSVALLRTAYLLTGDQERADQLVQESLIKAYPTLRGIREPRAAESNVRTAMVRTLTSRWRRPGWTREGVVTERLGVLAGRLWTVLATLPARERSVLVLRYFEDLTVQETAAVLSCSTRSAERLNIQALQILLSGTSPGSKDVGAAVALEDRLRRELHEDADNVELRPDFVSGSVESVLKRRRDRRRVTQRVAIVLAVLVVGGAATAIVGDHDTRKTEVDPPIPPSPSPPHELDAQDIHGLPPPEDVGKLLWRDTALPRVLPVDVASAPPLSADPVDHALALVAGVGAEVGVVGEDGQLRRLDGVPLVRPHAERSSTFSPVVHGSLRSDGLLAAFPQPDAVVVVDLSSGGSEIFAVPGPNARLLWLPNGHQLLVSRDDSTGSVLDIDDGSISGRPYSAYRAAFMPDGTPLEVRETGDWPARSDLIRWQENLAVDAVPILLRHRSETPASATDRLLVVPGTYEDPDVASSLAPNGWIIVDIATGAPVTMLSASDAWYDTWLFGLQGWLDDAVLIQTDHLVIAWTPSTGSIERVTQVSTNISLATDVIE